MKSDKNKSEAESDDEDDESEQYRFKQEQWLTARNEPKCQWIPEITDNFWMDCGTKVYRLQLFGGHLMKEVTGSEILVDFWILALKNYVSNGI